MSCDSIRSNIELQLTELEILQSIYSNDDEFINEDLEAFVEAQDFVDNKIPEYRNTLSFIIKLNAEIENSQSKSKSKDSEDTGDNYTKLPLQIVCRLPITYPQIEPPNVLVRCSKQNLNRKFTEDLSAYISESHANESSILDIIEWIKENVNKYLSNNNKNNRSDATKQAANSLYGFSRMWIYSHHIYSLNKRKSIVQWAKDFDLNGFSKPGKPGMICVEGESESVQKFWTQLRSVPWQKIQIKENELYQIEPSKLNEYQKFHEFKEMVFSNENDSHIDIGLLFAFLKEKGFQNVFNMYFGVDGKLPDSP